DGTRAAVHVDGRFLLGPEAAHLIIGGRSGVAAKTSYAGVLLRSALSRADEDHTVAAIVFNVKGEDLIWLDQEPEEELALTDADLAMYETMGVPATPFENVTVYSPRR